MHLFEDPWYHPDPTAAQWLSTLPYWILDWQNTDYYLAQLLYDYQQAAGPGPDRRDNPTVNPTIPVGPENVLSLPPQPGVELSNLVISEQPFPVLTTTPGTPTFGPEYISMGSHSVADWRNDPNHPNWLIGSVPTGSTTLNGGNDVSIFDDLGDIFVDWVGGQVNPPGSPGGPAPFDFPTTAPTGPPPGASPGPGVYPGVTAAACAPTGPSPVWKKVCGVYKWVIPKRRRRRALLTEGDYNSLLRIEGLKVNKNMTAAIAKALTR